MTNFTSMTFIHSLGTVTHKTRCCRSLLLFFIAVMCVFLFPAENAAEKELWRENTDYKDTGEFVFIQLTLFPQ